MGDLNARSTLWHNERPTAKGGSNVGWDRGRLVEEMVLRHHLGIINLSGEPATFCSLAHSGKDEGESNIDFTIASSLAAQRVTRWKVCTDMVSSQHRLISVELAAAKGDRPEPMTAHRDPRGSLVSGRLDMGKADWSKFRTGLEKCLNTSSWTPALTPAAIDAEVPWITRSLMEAAQLAIPRSRPSPFRTW
ncbi:hypothetical protein GE061_000243 [Apolygus lucorum]|uniref:Endonuclease/exonuclease/phosphatase domain-containing protein n=1 Tax=Apolygus lucorum TaxID=248454 RepID=A0A8S9Y5S4_APOLU|nr:hypothetical protein GE061_000243 [Apolygus lucorum]